MNPALCCLALNLMLLFAVEFSIVYMSFSADPKPSWVVRFDLLLNPTWCEEAPMWVKPQDTALFFQCVTTKTVRDISVSPPLSFSSQRSLCFRRACNVDTSQFFFFCSWRKFTTCSFSRMSETVVAWGNATGGQAHTHTHTCPGGSSLLNPC